MRNKILITGSAGFIGYHLVSALIKKKYNVIGLDNLNNYYDINLKKLRLKKLQIQAEEINASYNFFKIDILEKNKLEKIFQKNKFDCVIHLAAQAGVRHSIDNPQEFIKDNIEGFFNILEICRKYVPKHLLYASSSSVYGMNNDPPFKIDDNTDMPVSLYGATKKSNEIMAFSYSHLFSIPSTGMRFFTVYGPYGRPDMAYYLFTKAIIENEPINVFERKEMYRDFTFIDDVVKAIIELIPLPPGNFDNMQKGIQNFRVLNIGNNDCVTLEKFISLIELACGKNAKINDLPMHAGDVKLTHANIDDLKQLINYTPNTSLEDGIKKFVNWYLDYKK